MAVATLQVKVCDALKAGSWGPSQPDRCLALIETNSAPWQSSEILLSLKIKKPVSQVA